MSNSTRWGDLAKSSESSTSYDKMRELLGGFNLDRSKQAATELDEDDELKPANLDETNPVLEKEVGVVDDENKQQKDNVPK